MTNPFYVRQVRRLSGLRGFPRDVEAAKELVKALADAAMSEDHAERMISQWLQRTAFAPRAAELYQLASEVTGVDFETLPRGCPHCADVGWVNSEEKDGTSAQRTCKCPRGKAIRDLLGRRRRRVA